MPQLERIPPPGRCGRMRRPSPRTVAAVILVVAGVVWTRVNQPVEGRVLIVFDPGHRLTMADLPSLAAVAVAVCLLLPRRRR